MKAPELTAEEWSIIDETLMEHIDCLQTMLDVVGSSNDERAEESVDAMAALLTKLRAFFYGRSD